MNITNSKIKASFVIVFSLILFTLFGCTQKSGDPEINADKDTDITIDSIVELIDVEIGALDSRINTWIIVYTNNVGVRLSYDPKETVQVLSDNQWVTITPIRESAITDEQRWLDANQKLYAIFELQSYFDDKDIAGGQYRIVRTFKVDMLSHQDSSMFPQSSFEVVANLYIP